MRALRRRTVRSARAALSLSVLRLPLLARYDLAAARAWKRESLAGRAPEHVAVSRADAAASRRRAGHARRRVHAAVSRGATGRARSVSSACSSRTNRSIRPTRSRRAASRPPSLVRARSARTRLPSRRRATPATPPPPIRRPPDSSARCSSRRTPSSPSSTNAGCTGRDVTLVDGLITDAGRMAAETGKPLGWYDVVDAEGAVSRRRQEDDGLRAGRTARVALPDWIVYPTGGGTGLVGMWKAFDGDGSHRLGSDREASAHGVGAGGRLRAHRPRVSAGRREGGAVGERADASPTACASRARSATSSSCTPCARAAAPRSPSSDDEMVRDMLAIGKLEGVSPPRPKAAPR